MLSTLFIYVSYMFWTIIKVLLFIFIFFVHFQLLDYLPGHGHVALFRRAELKTLVNMHGNEVCMTAPIFYNFKLKANTPPPPSSTFSPHLFSFTTEPIFSFLQVMHSTFFMCWFYLSRNHYAALVTFLLY